jgi:hypothetical protein
MASRIEGFFMGLLLLANREIAECGLKEYRQNRMSSKEPPGARGAKSDQAEKLLESLAAVGVAVETAAESRGGGRVAGCGELGRGERPPWGL